MVNQNLTHATFWNRMDRAIRHVGKLPKWVKGSPINVRSASIDGEQCQGSTKKTGDAAASRARHDSALPRW
jgi:hypothetical protein